MTVSRHTIIHTISGDVLLDDLIDNKLPTYVYTWDGDQVTLGRIKIGKTSLQVPLKVELDDGSNILIGNGANLLVRDGTEKKARDVKSGASLLPLYLKKDGDGYTLYKEPGSWNKGALTRRDSSNWRRVSRMVAEWKLNRRCAPGDIVRFDDGNRANSHPDNLIIEYRAPKPRKQKAKFAEPIFEAQRLIRKFNHKVEEISLDISREMFSIKGVGVANFAIGGIFIAVDEIVAP